MRTPKGPNVRIACCTFKNQRASAVILETRNSTGFEKTAFAHPN